ncbi:hypothetical protein [Streptomyces pseudovenezuelae]|uniref:Uncharacterized protein n=1 Tax=Streptomyces pseudovenezuelae TaxID=67350 RepID=A0ABT6LJB7_9ACTN|nr:hypothetical protein [Streptomyces pseudovenezuelae]MDH6215459.1 hypothetical protein [Streptomyces pseudovenezuelae]
MRRRRFISGVVGAGAGLGLASASARATTGGDAGSTDARSVRAATASTPHDWAAVPAPACSPAAQLLGVAAAGPDLAWAVGEEGRNGSTRGTPLTLTWDGTVWNRLDLTHLGFGGYLRAVAGTADRAWAIGTDTAGAARLLAWDGTTWREADFPGRGAFGTSLTGVALGPDGDTWISGRTSDGLVLLHGHGTDWTWEPAPPSAPTTAPSGLRVLPSGDVWLYDSALVARWDGTAWTELPTPPGIRASVTGILPVADDDIWLTGYAYGVGGPPGKPPSVALLHGDGSTWTYVTAPFTVGMLTGIVDDGQGGPDRIAGWDFWDQTRAHHLRWDSGSWVSERGPTATTPVLPLALTTVPGAGGYWAVGTTSSYPYPPAQVHIEN